MLCAGLGWSGPALTEQARTAAEAKRIADAMQVIPGQLNRFEVNPGGRTTLHGDLGGQALSQPMADLSRTALMDFTLGRAMFQKLWVSSPSSTKASDGLGPRYNARNCAACHPGNGRGAAPDGDGPLPVALVLRLSVPAPTDSDAINAYLTQHPDPALGTQLQTQTVAGLSAEGAPTVRYTLIQQTLADGQQVTLRRPVYDAGTALSPDTMLSPRLAPTLQGMGLIDAILDGDIRANADPQDSNGDGISGRVNMVPARDGATPAIGRFGWKAETPSLRQQIADAFSHDIGISSALFPAPWGDCTALQTACQTAPHGDKDARVTELGDTGLALTTHFVTSLAVPARTTDPAAVLQGRDLFHDTGCAACHRPAYVTGRQADDTLRGFQMIWPYSDFLLHDMGPDLADNRPAYGASGSEWRTPPLWGMGRIKHILGTAYFLHDGRARSITEAILWHGGEAQSARDRFTTLPAPDRDALIAFLESL